MTTLLRAARLIVLGLCMFGIASHAFAAASTPTLELTLIRAIRVSDDTITLSFKTTESSVGQAVYTDSDGSTITLTDAEAQVDHLYTIDRLDPKHGYTFTLSATSRANVSNQYVVQLSPETIGSPGASIVPVVQVVTPQGEVVASTLAASTTPVATTTIPMWVYLLVIALLVLIWVLNRFMKQQSLREGKKPIDGTSP